ncbi:FG-GAP-like repeat-containing protein [Dyadobacter sp. CY261]|uniref:FG-GAP-like repeat-containing protein n=1 Tax=Dyadobacter sp. CY261 TaxID=2907203 RepID=UPI001F1D053B|nr:FG-GAP-like repeat-containing protein [Dyadobacter sp. CY261]MCF0073617.1 FG-GAP-like repeat-containing protein [Dyadobacter sp. CY261]
MKQTSRLLPLSVATPILILFIYGLFTCFQPNLFPHNEAGTDREITPEVPQSSLNSFPPGLSETIAAREYHISYGPEKSMLQSPNRRHDLRAYYEPGHFILQNRSDSAGNSFKLRLDNEGIFADGRLIHQPDANARAEISGNKLTMHHQGFAEEYINNQDGVRQNFIIRQAPDGTRQLQLTLTASGLKTVGGGENEILFFSKHDTLHPRLIYHDLQCWDAKKRPLIAHLTSKHQHIQITVDVQNAAYPITIDPLVINGNPGNADALFESGQANALFGFSVSSAGDVNGDGYSDVLAGAPHYDHGETNEGVAFLYYGSANGLNPAPYLLESNQPDAAMGYSVSSAGDINGDGFSDIAIGAPFFDKGQNDEGVVFVHLGSAKGIKSNPVAILEGNQFEAQFGISLALAGDVNGDGFSDVIAGANQFDQGLVNEGAAFVFYGSKSGIIPNKVSTLEINQANAMIASSVAGAGDVNGDGFGDVLVGAPFYEQGELDEGGVFVYLGSVNGPVNIPTIIQSNQANAHLGSSLGSAGDLNGDGYSDVLVGAPHYDKLHADQGLVNIHFGSALGVNANPSIELAGNQMEEEFGRSVGCAGDVNGDGYADLMVASRFQGKGPINEGGVSLFTGFQAGINKKPISILKSEQANALLGQSLGSAGDVNGDGFSDIIIGCHLYDQGQADEGAILLWRGSASGTDIASAATLLSAQPESAFGYAISGAGDVNGDGYDDVLVGAPHYDNGQADEGVAFIFHGTSHGISKTAALMLEANQADAGFGASVSSAGDVNGDGYADIVIGAMHFDDSEDEEGAAFVYLGSASGIQPAPVKLESNLPGAWLGCAVAHAGDLNGDGFSELIIGAMNYSNGQSEEGAIYLFPGSPTGPDVASKRIIEGNKEDARLGNSVAGAGDINGDGHDDIVAGAYSLGDYDAGAIWVGYGQYNALDSLTSEYIKGTQDQAHLGWDVSGAGDVNADGFQDVIVGANAYDNGDGAAFLYYGSLTGITPANVANLYSHETGMAAAMGESVAGAGDLNGDGYSDIVIGEPWFIDDKTWITTGLASIFFGSAAGLHPAPQRIIGNPNDAFDFFGWAVSGVGDVNADGFGDMIIGSPNFSSSQTDADAAFVYYGNKGSGMRNNLRLYNNDLVTLLNQNQKSKSDFGAGLFAKSFLGRNKGKLVWEAQASGLGFSQGANNVITQSTAMTGSQKGFSDLGIIGIELKALIVKQGISTKIRARVKYNPALALTGQAYGPWRYLPAYLMGNSATPPPERNRDLQKIIGNKRENDKAIVYPNPAYDILNIRSDKLAPIRSLTLSTNEGKIIFQSFTPLETLDLSVLQSGHYVLNIIYTDGSQISQNVIKR